MFHALLGEYISEVAVLAKLLPGRLPREDCHPENCPTENYQLYNCPAPPPPPPPLPKQKNVTFLTTVLKEQSKKYLENVMKTIS